MDDTELYDHEQYVAGPLCGYWEPWEGQEDAPFCGHGSCYHILDSRAPQDDHYWKF